MALIAAAVVYVIWVSRLFWYFDDWNYLGTDRSLSRPVHALLASHNGQIVVIPVLVFRAIEAVFRLRTYTPYAIPDLAAHFGIVVLLRRWLKRGGVHDSVATLMPLAILFLAVAYDDVLWDDQIGYLAALLLAMLSIDLLGTDALPSRHRVGVVAACCLFSVLSGDLGFALLFAIAAYAGMRHGWTTLSVWTPAPAAVAFLAWYLTDGRVGNVCPAGIHEVIRAPLFGVSAVEHSLDGLGGFKLSSVAVGLFGIYGASAVIRSGSRERVAASAAGLLGTILLYLEIGVSRSCLGYSYARQPRYAYFAAVLLLPLIGYGVDRIARRTDPSRYTIAIALGVVVVLNIIHMRLDAHLRFERVRAGAEQLALARRDQIDRARLPNPLSRVDPQVTPGELAYLVSREDLRLPSIPAHIPVGVPGE